MEGNALAFFSGIFFLLTSLWILVISLKRSCFGIFLLSSEYFFILGLGVFPILLSLNLISNSSLFLSYQKLNGDISIATHFHLIFYSIGMFCGYFLLNKSKKSYKKLLIKIAVNSNIDNNLWFFCIAIFSISTSILYFNIIGFENAIVNANFVRGGDLSGLDGNVEFLFLKRLTMIAIFIVSFLPYIFIKKKWIAISFLIVFLLSVLIYMQTVARTTFVELLLLYILLFFYFASRREKIILSFFILICIPFFITILLYGKQLLPLISGYYFSGNKLELIDNIDDEQWYSFLYQFGHLYYSIDAGIKDFFTNGPLLGLDVILSPFGIFPSSIYHITNLEFLDYHSVANSDRFSCINTSYFAKNQECSVPPFFTGASSYIFPLFGGFFFVWFKFYIFSILEKTWMSIKDFPEYIWLPAFIFLLFIKISSFIPNSIAFAFFILYIFSFFLLLKKITIKV